jgi:hypothetical protein
VTRLGEFSPNGWLSTLGIYIPENTQQKWATFGGQLYSTFKFPH